MTLRDGLDRTLLLMRDEVGNDLPDDVLVDALTTTSVALVGDAANLASHTAQTAFVTAAILMARSAHRVFIVAPDITLVGPQPPLPPGSLIDGLIFVGRDMLPEIEFTIGSPQGEVDLAAAFGDTPIALAARRRIRLSANPWAGMIEPENSPRRWPDAWWPAGGLVAGGLAAGEAFKAAILKLLPHALNPSMMAAVFAETDQITFALAPPGTPFAPDFGDVDFVSGGAINSSALYAIARIPAVRMRGRVIEPDDYDISNLNRYPLMFRSHVGHGKAATLTGLLGGGISLEPVPDRYYTGSPVEPLAPNIVVGVDDIPSRWAVQRTWPDGLVVGATTHWSSMASFHEKSLGCAQCLHPDDDPSNAPIPTVACVSFFAGLLTFGYLARQAAGCPIPATEQQTFLTPFRLENRYIAPVPVRPGCPTCALKAH
jgi:hypothetical protein